MPLVEISEEVYQAIVERGRFGETTLDQVLRRILEVPQNSITDATSIPIKSNTPDTRRTHRPRQKIATRRLTSYVENNELHLIFEDGISNSWPLPNILNKLEIKKVRNEAVEFARNNGATDGQQAAVKKTLTSAGYHLIK